MTSFIDEQMRKDYDRENKGPNLPKIQSPPVGLTPRFIHEEKRMQEVVEAIGRYLTAMKPIPVKWIEEYNYLCKLIRKKG